MPKDVTCRYTNSFVLSIRAIPLIRIILLIGTTLSGQAQVPPRRFEKFTGVTRISMVPFQLETSKCQEREPIIFNEPNLHNNPVDIEPVSAGLDPLVLDLVWV